MIGLAGRRALSHLSSLPKQRPFQSCLLQPLNNTGDLVVNHPLDTNLAAYYKVIKDIIIPDCREIAPDVDGYADRMEKLISYTNPAFNDCWNFGVELQYRLNAPPEHQTEENLTKVRILRGCMDLTFTMSALLDDVVDESTSRKGKPAWHKISDGGEWAGMYDGMVLGYAPFFLIKRHFSELPCYGRLLEIFGMGNMLMIVGEIIDLMGQRVTPDADLQVHIAVYKTSQFIAMQAELGMAMAGVTDKTVIEQVRGIYTILGTLIQSWDDFCDYYSPPTCTGKLPIDFQNAGTTWVSATAWKCFNESQKKIFKECYGSLQPDALETVRRLYDEVDIPELYLRYLKNGYDRVQPLMEAIQDVKVREACRSHVNWLIGDVAQMTFDN